MAQYIKHGLRLSTLAAAIALAGCGEDFKDCGGFWDKTFGRDGCVVKNTVPIILNKQPQASFTVALDKLNVSLDATNSKDEDGSIVDYQWFVNGVNQNLSKTSPKASITLTEGVHHIRLVVKDNLGAIQESDQSVTVTSTGETQAVMKFKENVFTLSPQDESSVLSTEILPDDPANLETDIYINFKNPSPDVTERKAGEVYFIGRSEKFPLGLMAEITEPTVTKTGVTTLGLKYVQLPQVFENLNVSFPKADTSSQDVEFYSVVGSRISEQDQPAVASKSTKRLLLPLPDDATFEDNQCLGKSGVKLCVKVEQEGATANSITAQIKGEYKPDAKLDESLEITTSFKRKISWLDSKDVDIKLEGINLEMDYGFKYKIEESLGVDLEAKATSEIGGGTKKNKLLFNATPLQRLFYGEAALKSMQSAGEYKFSKYDKEVVIKGIELDKDKLLLGAFVIDRRTILASGAGGIAGFLKSGLRRGSDIHKSNVDFSVYLLMFMKLDGTITGKYHYEYNFPDETVDVGFKDSKPYHTVTDKGESTSKHTIKASATASAGAGLDLGVMIGNVVPAQATAEGALTAEISGEATWENQKIQGCLNNAGLYVGGRVYAETALSIEIKDAESKGWLSFVPDYSREAKWRFPLAPSNPDQDWKKLDTLLAFDKGGEYFCQKANLNLRTLQEPSVLNQNEWKIRADASDSNITTIESMAWNFGDGTIEVIKEDFANHLIKEHVYTKPNRFYSVALNIKYKDDTQPDGYAYKTLTQIFEAKCSEDHAVVGEQCLPKPKIMAEPTQVGLGQQVKVWISGVFDGIAQVLWRVFDQLGNLISSATKAVDSPFEASYDKEGEYKVTAEYQDNKGTNLGQVEASFQVKARRVDDFKDEKLENLYEVQKIGLDTSDGTLRLPLNVGDADSTFPYIWIANSGEGTISKLATRDHTRQNPHTGQQEQVTAGQELGRYRTGPGNGNPSRTTVDQDGNVWVGNRGYATNGGARNNTITKVGLAEFGQCIDRNSNGVIDTSTGATDIKDWVGFFGDGQGFAGAQDECILQHVALEQNGVETPSDIRMIAIDKDNNVFAGGHLNRSVFKVSGSTGQIINAANTNGSFYGGLVDKQGNLWAASRNYHGGVGRVLKVSNDLSTSEVIHSGLSTYGIALDKYGKIWTTDAGTTAFSSFNVADPVSTLQISYQQGRGYRGCYAQGIAVDDSDNIFIAGCRDATDFAIGHYKQMVNGSSVNVEFVANYRAGGGPTGVAIDGKGNVWSTNEYYNSVSRVTLAADPANAKVDTFPVGRTPYNYSDMTGRTVRNLTNRQGTWEATFDGAVSDFEWKKLVWTLKQALPVGTNVTASAKAANSKIELGGLAYVDVANNQALTNMKGRFIKVRFRLTSENAESTPEITGIDLQ